MYIFALGQASVSTFPLAAMLRRTLRAEQGTCLPCPALSFCPTTNTGFLTCRPSWTPLQANDIKVSCGDSHLLTVTTTHFPVVHSGIIETVYLSPAFIHMKRVTVLKSPSVFRGPDSEVN